MITCVCSISSPAPRRRRRPADRRARVSAASAGSETSERGGAEQVGDADVLGVAARPRGRGCGTTAPRRTPRRASTTSVGRAWPQSSSRSARLARLGLLERGGVEDRDRAAAGVQRERAAQRRALLLAVDLEGVGAGLGAEHGAAAGPDRRAARARAGAAGALLAPRLGAAAGDHGRAFSSRRSRAGERPARRARSGARAARAKRAPKAASSSLTFLLRAAQHGGVSHRCAPPRSSRSGPGTEPRTSSRFSLGVDAHDLEPLLGRALVAHLARRRGCP